MDPKVIICFSAVKKNLHQILNELPDCFGEPAEIKNFSDREDLLHFLTENRTFAEKVQNIILDFQDAETNTLEFIVKINRLLPYCIKTIIAQSIFLSEIRLRSEGNQYFQFIPFPWNSAELQLAVRIAEDCFFRMRSIARKEEKIAKLAEMLEEKTTERLKELIDSNSAKDKLLSIIAHDLKNPFLALIGISEILLNNWNSLPDNEKLELISDLHTSSQNTYKLLENLLDWSKSQKQKLTVIPRFTQIQPIVEFTSVLAEKNASAKEIDIQNNISDKLIVKADENMISTVFRNLISNAVKFTPRGGYIRITAEEGEDFYTFCIADNGKGIDQPYILELLKPEEKKQTNPPENGFKGFGLILCKHFVEQNGGKLWLETEIGKGSKFYFTIPKAGN